MRFILFITLLFGAHISFADNIVRIKKSITINAPTQTVFEYVCDYFNDIEWRKEVNSIESNGEVGVGTIFIEDAKLGRKDHFITETRMLTLVNGEECVAETTERNSYFLRSSRFFEVNEGGQTKFTYFVEFDKKMSKEIFGFVPPSVMLKFFYGKRMKKYLRVLKKLMENK